ncbi:MAG: chemotaxis protein CheW [Bdellovibrionales bacterium]|nr:chemotaxis protein CheW [Bdellovibrionales bacterium]
MTDDILKEFLLEASELVDSLDREMIQLEAEGDLSILLSIFRKVHTIKGTCGFLGLTRLEGITHVGENLLDLLRSGERQLTRESASALLRLLDAMRECLGHIEQHGTEPAKEYTELCAELQRLVDAKPMASVAVSETKPSPVRADAIAPSESPAPETAATELNLTAPSREATPMQHITASDTEEAGKSERSGELSAELKRSALSDSSLRIDVTLLDKLMNLVGELVLARNQILQHNSLGGDQNFARVKQRLNLITTELQEQVMKTRMQPITNVWNKFPRVVRDLSHTCNKKVKVEMEGKETDLDKTLLEAIKDPLTHIVRNAVDHGIELPEERIAAGKSPEGTLSLRALHEGGHVIIQISDDGGGLDVTKIKRKAVQNGILSAERAETLSAYETFQLIFSPGFSTAEKVTHISGRGVGMDVVKTNIEKVGGVIHIQSELGKGTTFTLKIPLTLAIIPALMVESSDQRYAIPQVSLVELVRVSSQQFSEELDRVGDSLFYRLRGNLLPMVDLNALLTGETSASFALEEQDVLNIVVLRAENSLFGLIVDQVHDTEEIVVKPLGKQLKDLSIFAGATILGDGRVALILDVLGISKRAAVCREERHERREVATDRSDAERESLLIVSCRSDERIGLPLDLIDRLEEFELAEIERAASQKVVQYRGGILPLVDLSELLTGEPLPPTDSIRVVVFSEGARRVGLVVNEILDVVDEEIKVAQHRCGANIRGSAIVQGRVTDLLDCGAIMATS